MSKLWHTNKVKMGEESMKSMKSNTQRGVTVNGSEWRTLNFDKQLCYCTCLRKS